MSFFRPTFAHKVLSKDTSSENEEVSFVASTALGGHRAVRMSGGSLVYADNTEISDAALVLGITLNSAAPGELVQIQQAGFIEESSWSWTPDQPIFLSVNGLLTQATPVAGFSLLLAIAISPTLIQLGIKMPIILEV